jgi:hypothetical protein
MMIDPIISPIVLYEAIKFWLPVSAFFFGIYKGWDWVKSTINEIKTDVKEMKASILEQRQDFRSFLLPLFAVAQGQAAKAQPVRAKRTRKTPIKKK